MVAFNLDLLDKTNEQLKAITKALDGYQKELQSIVDNGGPDAQAKLDAKIDEINGKLSKQLKPVRDNVEKAVKPPYEQAMQLIAVILPLYNLIANLSLENIISAVTQIINFLIGPYQPLIQLTTQLPPKVAELSENLQKVASYQIDVDTSKTQLVVKPLSVDIEPISLT